jgi:eukaryotic-like serine/threonine-protein kinase
MSEPSPEAVEAVFQQALDLTPERRGAFIAEQCGDIEIIAAKALEKDKTRRYASAAQLASDIRLYQRGEAILARPPSALYQLRKLARRHKALVAGVSGIFATLLLGTAVSIFFALGAAENARIANQSERIATYHSYQARMAAAVAGLSRHDVVDAARQLDAAPQALRGWEWQHLAPLDRRTAERRRLPSIWRSARRSDRRVALA